MRALIGIPSEARDELHGMRNAIKNLPLYRDAIWLARDEKQGAVGVRSVSAGPCERTMGYEVPEEAKVRVENLPRHLRSISK